MVAPLKTAEEILSWISSKISDVEVSLEFPTDITRVHNGIYVGGPVTASRTPNKLGIQTGANIYDCSDTFQVVIVSFQGDHLLESNSLQICEIIQDPDFFDGYYERDWVIKEQQENRAVYRTIDFTLRRIEFL